MNSVRVTSILGIGQIPSDRRAAGAFLKRHCIDLYCHKGDGRCTEYVALSSLPADIRHAYFIRECEYLRIDPGERDEDAHARLRAASPGARERAEMKAQIVLTLVKAKQTGAKEAESFAIVREKFPEERTSTSSLRRYLRAVKGVDPINFAPTLLDDYKPTAKRAKIHPDDWRLFLSIITHAAEDFPLTAAYRDVRDLAAKDRRKVPSLATFQRRWKALPVPQQLVARHGREKAVDHLTQPDHRDKQSLRPMQIVSLDGRIQDFWVDWGNGRAVRPVMIALVDVASNYVLGFELAQSENANATVR